MCVRACARARARVCVCVCVYFGQGSQLFANISFEKLKPLTAALFFFVSFSLYYVFVIFFTFPMFLLSIYLDILYLAEVI